jgi:hypothetical protein
LGRCIFDFTFVRCCGGDFATTSTALSKRAHASGRNSICSFREPGDFAMAKTYAIERVSGTAEYDLSPCMCREVGRITVHWAYIEHIVQQMVWDTLAISHSAGRTSVREPRVSDRLEMLRDLVKLRGAEWDDDLNKSVLARAKLVEAKRNLVCHGKWALREDGWHVELTRGSWPKNVRELVAGNRKITPELIPMNIEKLREATSEIDALIEDIKRLRLSALGPPPPSLGKRP